jgi:hypothetical protein
VINVHGGQLSGLLRSPIVFLCGTIKRRVLAESDGRARYLIRDNGRMTQIGQ